MSGSRQKPQLVTVGEIRRNAGTSVNIIIEMDRGCGAVILKSCIADWLHGDAKKREHGRGPIRLRLEKLADLIAVLEDARDEARRRGWLQ